MNSPVLKRLVNSARYENPFFQPDDLYLRSFIDSSLSDDPSLRSMSYLKMTSRKGLFSFNGEYTILLFSVHPNRNDTYIIYAPDSDAGFKDVRELAGILKARGRTVEIIRVAEKYLPICLELTQGRAIDEQTLDYIFPVHVVDTKMVSEMQGTKFLKFRNKINAIRKTSIRMQKVDWSPQTILALRSVSKKWSALMFGPEDQHGADYIFHALDTPSIRSLLQGLVAYQDNEPVGFTLWENPALGYSTANSLIHCCLHDRGLSEMLHHDMAVSLYERDIRFLSLGGAETAGLDAFKRKMNPVRSVVLKTVAL